MADELLKDLPHDLPTFLRRFGTDARCRAYLVRARWPGGFRCTGCGHDQAWSHKKRLIEECTACGKQHSILAGTIFEQTKTGLSRWFLAIYLVTSSKGGISAMELQRQMGFGSYQTAWTWLHKLRRAMVRPERERLHGSVEVDETYVGGAEKGGKRGRGSKNKEIVVIAVEVLPSKGFGRIRMRRVPDVSGDSLVPFICEVVEPDSEILTDGWSGYNSLSGHSYTHSRTVLSESGDPAHVAMPGVHRIAALLKRWLLGIHQGAVSGKHLEYYLDEYTFRFNRRTSRSRGMLFYRLIQQAVATASAPYRQLVDGNHNI